MFIWKNIKRATRCRKMNLYDRIFQAKYLLLPQMDEDICAKKSTHKKGKKLVIYCDGGIEVLSGKKCQEKDPPHMKSSNSLNDKIANVAKRQNEYEACRSVGVSY